MRQHHVLLGWEFGAGRGHIDKLLQIGRLLVARGHRVSYALQRVDVDRFGAGHDAEIWQAPLTPRLLVNTRKPSGRPPVTLGDILARLGLDDPLVVAGVLRAWGHLLRAVQPDLVIGDYAPLLMLAARGRIPTIASGTGFDVPPAEMRRFPPLVGGSVAYDEQALLAAVNQGARSAGARPLDALPQLFGADLQMPATFAEIDPYAEFRRGPLYAPAVADPPPPLAAGGGEEVFVYIHEGLPVEAPLWRGLEQSRLPVRAYVAGATSAVVTAIERRGIAVETRPVPFSRITERTRLLLSHGSHGFVCSGLLAGLPHILCHYDLEKAGIAQRIAAMGLGGHVPLHAIDPGPFAESLIRAYRDQELAGRSRAAAPAFRSRVTDSVASQVVAEAENLVFAR